MNRRRVLIMGAAGRDFHNFNVCYRHNETVEVVCFTATQIPDIEGRLYPPVLAGPLYPKGIPIYPESELARLIVAEKIDEVIFSYSDVGFEYVMRKGAQVNALGAAFTMLGYNQTAIETKVPVISVCAVRTGCGKSQTTRTVCALLREAGLKVAAIRHPMPYGDLTKQIAQRFATLEDMDLHRCTIEEREEYEPHIIAGNLLFAGVDYGEIAKLAELEADVIVWDGGNNDLPFYKSNYHIVVVDPHRPGHELEYYPGLTNLLAADCVVINKIDTADFENIETVRANIHSVNPRAVVVDGASPVSVEHPELLPGKKVLVIEDGPTVTHGGMGYGAGVIAATKFGAEDLVDPRPYTVGTITETFEKYPDIGTILPAMGYSDRQVKDLEKTIANTPCDAVVIATPIDLRRICKISQPSTRVTYDLQEIGHPTLKDLLTPVISKFKK